jgi:hypothetical protein
MITANDNQELESDLPQLDIPLSQESGILTVPVQPYRTISDKYNMFRIYSHGRPNYTPDESTTISDICDSPNIATNISSASRKWSSPWGLSADSISTTSAGISFAPFPNISIFRLMSWYYNSSNTKSLGELGKLVNDVILADDFQKEDFIGFNASKESKRMDHPNRPGPTHSTSSTSVGSNSSLPLLAKDGWISTSVFISTPCDGISHTSEHEAPKFEVKGLYYRRPLEVIKAAFSEPGAEKFHTTPFKSYWKPGPNEPEERIYSESYTADAFLDEYTKIRTELPSGAPEPVIAGLMTYSDSTHLTSFGSASLWPIYLFIGNQSKYARAKPSSFAAHHLAYIPKVRSVA